MGSCCGEKSDRSKDQEMPGPDGVRGVDRGIHYSFFGGRIVVGPDYKALIVSSLLILVPIGTYDLLATRNRGNSSLKTDNW